MKVSLNTVKQYVGFELPAVDELVTKINKQLGGVEEIIDLAKKYQGIVVVKVVECAPLEGTDHLNLTKVDDGGVVEGVERDENGLVQVVCGAPNVHAGMYAVWLSPGLTVPSSYSDAEPFVLGAKKLRGVVSNGMLASPKELDLGDDHDGILEIAENEVTLNDYEIKAGANFAEAFGLNDTIIDIENKMFTHRPDCFGQLGVAREIAGIFGEKFVSPPKYIDQPQFEHGEGLALSVDNEITDKVPRFMALAMKDVEVKPSPLWLRCELVRLGAKPINNVVDVTNYVMLHTAQPVHAYDYDKVASGKLGVRLAKKGEKITLLGGKEISLDVADIVITDGSRPIGLAGVMGGQDTEVSSDTKNLILECANFDMFTVRRTSMRHGLFTDASTRFTKGQSPLQNDRVLLDLFKYIAIVSGGEPASDAIDLASDSLNDCITDDGSHQYPAVELTGGFINERLGLDLSNEQIKTLLENVEFRVDVDNNGLNVYPSFWRTDIDIVEDVVEEVGRLYGFDNVRHELPQRSLTPAVRNPRRVLKRQLRELLSQAGANEVLTYSFVHKNILERAGQDPEDTYQLSNALSPDLHYFRRSVLPSLLDKVHMNVKAGYGKFALFEIGKGHKKSAGVDDDGVPVEQEFLSMAIAGGDFYQAKAYTEFLASKLGIAFEYVPVQTGKLFEPKRSALVKANGMVVGAVGEFRNIIKRNFKLPDTSAGFEIDFGSLLKATEDAIETYKPLGRFPSAGRDMTLSVPVTTAYGDVWKTITATLAETGLDTKLDHVDIYQPEGADTKNITLRITVASPEKTLTGEEVANVLTAVADSATQKLDAQVI
jgi:phenylalanyl-tRNA synthetase beta chain